MKTTPRQKRVAEAAAEPQQPGTRKPQPTVYGGILANFHRRRHRCRGRRCNRALGEKKGLEGIEVQYLHAPLPRGASATKSKASGPSRSSRTVMAGVSDSHFTGLFPWLTYTRCVYCARCAHGYGTASMRDLCDHDVGNAGTALPAIMLPLTHHGKRAAAPVVRTAARRTRPMQAMLSS